MWFYEKQVVRRGYNTKKYIVHIMLKIILLPYTQLAQLSFVLSNLSTQIALSNDN